MLTLDVDKSAGNLNGYSGIAFFRNMIMSLDADGA